ncbi:hypothetical protein Naga_100169g4 [Nannochloropsis gaditana]|uniref:Uncharacterized protein n=1 Tax=Nannochloropsis gaditana TaxID=72520 RepID=W7T4C4_9STRA|nr:hypothetical protein Naga_100169g4 [Nannochloropsis gaditana]
MSSAIPGLIPLSSTNLRNWDNDLLPSPCLQRVVWKGWVLLRYPCRQFHTILWQVYRGAYTCTADLNVRHAVQRFIYVVTYVMLLYKRNEN